VGRVRPSPRILTAFAFAWSALAATLSAPNHLEEVDRHSEIRPERSQIRIEHSLVEAPRGNLKESSVAVVYVPERVVRSAKDQSAEHGRFGTRSDSGS
jgi:hypothetical protein